MATAKMKGSTFPRYEQNRFFSFPVVKKALSLLPGRAHQSLSEGHLEAKEKKKSKLLGPELFSFWRRDLFFNQKRTNFVLGGGVCTFFHFFPSCLCDLLLEKAFVLCLNEQLTYYVFVSSFIKQLKTQVIIVRQPPRSPVLTEPATIERVFRPLDAGRG